MNLLPKYLVCLLIVVFVLPACETLEASFPPGDSPQNPPTSKPPTAAKPGTGPLDHAPAHGYRKKHPKDDVQLSYDQPSGVYVVIGFANHFFSGDSYFRLKGTNWEMSSGIGGPWSPAPDGQVPGGIRDKKGKGNSQGKGKGKGKNK